MILGSADIAEMKVGTGSVSKVYLGTEQTWPTGFDPASLSPALWLDASDAATLYDAATGGSLVSADGAVARWEDKSGNSRHATQATSGSRPLRKTAVQNSLDVLRFDGANDYLATASFSGSQSFERFVVCNDRSFPSQTKIVVAQATSFDSPSPGADYMLNTGRSLETSQNGSSGVGSLSQRRTGQVFNGTTFILAGQRGDGTHAGHVIRVNGAAPSVTSPFTNNPGTYTKASSAYGIGARSEGSLPMSGDIGEVLHFTRVLTTDERTALEAYLMEKWGIS